MIRPIAAFILAVGVFYPLPVSAEELIPQHAIAMYGSPLYPSDFDHFDFVNPQASKGGVISRAEIGTFDNLNPFLITGRVTSGLQEALLMTYDSLMTRGWGEPYTMYGLVAKQVILPKERNWIIYLLDPKARFNDGHPVTAQDVAFSFEALKKSGRPNQRRIYSLVNKVTIVNPHKIRFDFGQGYDRETAFILSNMPVLPKHYWQGKDFSKTTLKPPIGSGPYRIGKIDIGRQITFKRNKDYWAKDNAVNRGLYNFDTIQFNFFRDQNILLQSIAAGQVDLHRETSAVAWKRDYHFKAIDEGALKKYELKNGRPLRAKFMVYNMRRPIFSDIRVRQALAYLFDFEWLNKNLFFDTQVRINSLFMNTELASPSPVKLPKTDGSGLAGMREPMRQANILLEQAGYRLQNGVMTNQKTGQALTFEILLNDSNDEKIALAFVRNLQRLGIVATIRTVDTTQYIGRLTQFDFDMTINAWRNSLSPGTEQSVYWGSQAAGQQGSFNYSGLASPKVDKLIKRLTNVSSRSEWVQAAQALDHAVMAQWIGIPLFDAKNDRFIALKNISFPEKTSLYGTVLESWWYSDAKSDKRDKDNP
jgi:ABC-type oligopeptide transport system substrate-binding subunit